MNFEDFQKAWRSQDARAKVTVDAEVLLKEVRRNEQQFRATIFWRDVREVCLALLLTLYFAYHGLRHHDWTDYLIGFVCFGIGAFMVVDRLLQHRKRPASNDPLKTCIENSLHQVSHQIWLLKNVFWSYLLPLAAALEISICVAAWHSRNNPIVALFGFVAPTSIVILLYWVIYRFNQSTVRKDLEPRRKQLETLLASLN